MTPCTSPEYGGVHEYRFRGYTEGEYRTEWSEDGKTLYTRLYFKCAHCGHTVAYESEFDVSVCPPTSTPLVEVEILRPK